MCVKHSQELSMYDEIMDAFKIFKEILLTFIFSNCIAIVMKTQWMLFLIKNTKANSFVMCLHSTKLQPIQKGASFAPLVVAKVCQALWSSPSSGSCRSCTPSPWPSHRPPANDTSSCSTAWGHSGFSEQHFASAWEDRCATEFCSLRCSCDVRILGCCWRLHTCERVPSPCGAVQSWKPMEMEWGPRLAHGHLLTPRYAGGSWDPRTSSRWAGTGRCPDLRWVPRTAHSRRWADWRTLYIGFTLPQGEESWRGESRSSGGSWGM